MIFQNYFIFCVTFYLRHVAGSSSLVPHGKKSSKNKGIFCWEGNFSVCVCVCVWAKWILVRYWCERGCYYGSLVQTRHNVWLCVTSHLLTHTHTHAHPHALTLSDTHRHRHSLSHTQKKIHRRFLVFFGKKETLRYSNLNWE